MDDCCAVCAEPLEWVAYGSCGHREVCSTCVVRLRFILNEKKCCLCKIESPIVFVTKALGDYTRTIGDFSTFPTDAAEGPVGRFWYHEDTQAFFDDSDHYKMIKAMCRLSCSVCDRSGEEQKRKAKFRNVEQLKGHLFHRHKLLMCSLCLEGRKVFICEQKLYTRAQLNQHIGTGDSEVDGTESERGGFMGHPMCEFCRNPFYGDNELYLHMSTEHYTCHICQRQHPGQYDYYKNYDDLEIHFRNEHFLCENEACLGKKFIVFQSESEMKRHNAIEHGGHMSRSKRNAVLQIPTSFRYRRNGENDQRRGRGRGSRTDSSANQLSLAIQASFEMANPDSSTFESSSSALPVPNPGELSDSDPPMNSFDLLTVTSDVEPHSRYLQAVSQSSRNGRLEESSFPPLAVGPSSSIPKPSQEAEGRGKNTMAARLRQRNKGTVTVLNSAQRPWSGNGLLNNSLPIRPMPNAVHVSSSSGGSTQSWPAINDGLSSSSSTSSSQVRPATDHGHAGSLRNYLGNSISTSKGVSHSISSSSTSSSQVRPATDHGHAGSIRNYSGNTISTSKGVSHSISAPNLVASNSGNGQQLLKVDDVHNANKSLVERIRDGLGMDENKYAAFKEISSEFRQGEIGTWEYLAYVEQFGLSHLVLELARLCPDPRKQRELIETYNANVLSNRALENGRSNSASSKEVDTCTTAKGKSVENSLRKGKVKSIQNGSSKGKGESVDPDAFSKKDTLADSIIDSVRELQANYKPSEEVEVLSKDGYRGAKGRLKVEDQVSLGSSNKQVADSRGRSESSSNGSTSNQNLNSGGANSKQRRKTSKFHRVRLGDGSAAALLDRRRFDASPEGQEESEEKNDESEGGLSARGVWRNGGGQRLVALTQKDHPK